MRSRHITRFGSPLSASGALYCVFDDDGLIQMDIDLQLAKLETKGMVITRDTKSQVKQDVKEKRAAYREEVKRIGIPDNLKSLISTTRKNKTEQYARDTVISEHELFLLIYNCSQMGFSHRSKFRQYVPSHLSVSGADREEMKAGRPKRFTKKFSASLLERRYLHVHIFERGADWHCFYFSHQDIESGDTNHWKGSCHVHYLSHLWPNLDKKWVWSRFTKRQTDISNSLHIRFEPLEFDSPARTIVWPRIFDPQLACGADSLPLPVVQVTTRGACFTKVSIPYKRTGESR